MAQDYDTGGTFSSFLGTPDAGTLFGQTMGLAMAPLLAASIFLGILNVFQFLLALRTEAPLMAQTEPRTRRS
jgi:hypothetical protein